MLQTDDDRGNTVPIARPLVRSAKKRSTVTFWCQVSFVIGLYVQLHVCIGRTCERRQYRCLALRQVSSAGRSDPTAVRRSPASCTSRTGQRPGWGCRLHALVDLRTWWTQLSGAVGRRGWVQPLDQCSELSCHPSPAPPVGVTLSVKTGDRWRGSSPQPTTQT